VFEVWNAHLHRAPEGSDIAAAIRRSFTKAWARTPNTAATVPPGNRPVQCETT
jgi:hypothetical protein